MAKVYMAHIHEQLTHAENLAQIDMAAYIQELVRTLRMAYGASTVAIKVDVSDVTLPFDAVSPCGLLINELVSNAMKHAFPPPPLGGMKGGGKEGGHEMRIAFESREGEYVLTVGDNGVGLPDDVDPENPTSLGLTLVDLLTRQLNGTLEVGREAGTTFRVVFDMYRGR